MFTDITTIEDLRTAVCEACFRPVIPTNVPESLRNLLTKSWAHKPNSRPSFGEIVTSLDEVLIDLAIDDEDGRQMWKEEFGFVVSQSFFVKLVSSSYSILYHMQNLRVL